MYSGMMYGGQLPYAGLGEDTPAIRAEITATLKKLHGTAASLADSKARYQQTGDQRYLQSVASVLPLYKKMLERLADLYHMQGDGEVPSSFMLVLSDLSDWLVDNVAQPIGDTLQAAPKVVNAVSNPLVLVALAGAVFMIFGGGDIIKSLKRR